MAQSCSAAFRRLRLVNNSHGIYGGRQPRTERYSVGISSRGVFGTTERDVGYLMENNYRYTKVLCDWAVSHSARFVYASSAATYGDGSNGMIDDEAKIESLRPLNAYGYSKQLFDRHAKQRGLFPVSSALSISTSTDQMNGTKEICEALSIRHSTRSAKLARFDSSKVTSRRLETASRSETFCTSRMPLI